MPAYVLTYDFHISTVNEIDKSIEKRSQTYETFEALLADYRIKKSALLWDTFPYMTDFKVFKLTPTEVDLAQLDNLL